MPSINDPAVVSRGGFFIFGHGVSEFTADNLGFFSKPSLDDSPNARAERTYDETDAQANYLTT